MNKKVWLSTLVASLGAGALLAQNTNTVVPANPPTNPVAPAPVILPPVTNLPAVEAPSPTAEAVTPDAAAAPQPKKKAVAKKPAPKAVSSGLPASHVPVDPPVTATVKVDALNVRGLPSFSGEVIAKLHKGDAVTVTEEITLDKIRPGEPAKWARILLPANTPDWVAAHLIDTNTMTVKARKLNVRGGPSENYNVVGRLDKGTTIKEVRKKDGWIQIEAPANASAFVSLELLDKSSSVIPAPAPVVEPAPVVVAPTPTPEPAPLPPPQVVTLTPDTNSIVMPANDAQIPAPVTPEPVPAPAPAPVDPVVVTEPVAPAITEPTISETETNDLPKRIITREGVVRISRNIQAPTYYELRDAKSNELIDYLKPTQEEMDLRSYVGKKVIVSGEEAMDRRWKYTPVVEVQSIDLP